MVKFAMLTLAFCALVFPSHAQAQEPAREQDRIVLGKLGQAIADTNIYKSPNTKAAVWCKVGEFEYLVLNPYEKSEWTKVLLTNGKQGFVLTEKIASLPYNVTAPQPSGSVARGEIKRALDYY